MEAVTPLLQHLSLESTRSGQKTLFKPQAVTCLHRDISGPSSKLKYRPIHEPEVLFLPSSFALYNRSSDILIKSIGDSMLVPSQNVARPMLTVRC